MRSRILQEVVWFKPTLSTNKTTSPVPIVLDAVIGKDDGNKRGVFNFPFPTWKSFQISGPNFHPAVPGTKTSTFLLYRMAALSSDNIEAFISFTAGAWVTIDDDKPAQNHRYRINNFAFNGAKKKGIEPRQWPKDSMLREHCLASADLWFLFVRFNQYNYEWSSKRTELFCQGIGKEVNNNERSCGSNHRTHRWQKMLEWASPFLAFCFLGLWIFSSHLLLVAEN